MTGDMRDYLRQMVGMGASDLHVKPGNRPGFRIDGRIEPLPDHTVLGPEDTARLARQLMTPEQHERFMEERDLDFSYAVEDVGRFRVNVLTQRSSIGLVIRHIPDRVPTIAELELPAVCVELASKPRGLVLVTGPTGSGKSTTLAALIDHINGKRQGHILTMEDPIEFVHRDRSCFVTQRQVGQDTKNWHEALRRALRQDPDVILIGELRDLETIAMAITAAETGHLVLGTLHTTSAISTVDRIIDVFPPGQQQQVRVQLSATLQGVISQCLLPRIGGGRVGVHEILVATNAVRSLIREGKTPQILNVLQTGVRSGMQLLEGALAKLVDQQVIGLDEAIGKANRPEEVRALCARAPTARSEAGRGTRVGAGLVRGR